MDERLFAPAYRRLEDIERCAAGRHGMELRRDINMQRGLIAGSSGSSLDAALAIFRPLFDALPSDASWPKRAHGAHWYSLRASQGYVADANACAVSDTYKSPWSIRFDEVQHPEHPEYAAVFFLLFALLGVWELKHT